MTIGGQGSLLRVVAASALFLIASGAAQAQTSFITISTDPTSNMTCSAGTCTASPGAATLNVKDMIGYLKAGNLTVTDWANSPDIVIDAPVTWAKSTVLTMVSHSITFAAQVKINGKGGVNLETQGTSGNFYLGFQPAGSLTYLHTSGSLRINNQTYVLEKDIKGLAQDIAKNPGGNFALANDYDAGIDGTYKRSPIATALAGKLNGLGHNISNLTIVSKAKGASVGLFASLDANGFPGIQNLNLIDVSIEGGKNALAGAVAGSDSTASISQVFVSGSVSVPQGTAGGVVGNGNGALIAECTSQADVSANLAGGLVGNFGGSDIINSMATGTVTSQAGPNAPVAGGLAGEVFNGAVLDSYSTGSVSGPGTLGGAIGEFIGTLSDVYWDTTTSGQSAGCGADTCVMTGLTTAQLQSGLPAGFFGPTWAETAGINNGMPYLSEVPTR
jgi:The GLUG motif